MDDGDLRPMIDGSPEPRLAATALIQEAEGDNEKQRLAVDGHYLGEQANSCTISEVAIDKVMTSIPQTNYFSPAKIVPPINDGGKMMTTNEVVGAIWGYGDMINADYCHNMMKNLAFHPVLNHSNYQNPMRMKLKQMLWVEMKKMKLQKTPNLLRIVRA